MILGTGWYNCHTAEVWDFTTAPWRHQPKLLLQLHLTLADGSERVLVSDAGWKVGHRRHCSSTRCATGKRTMRGWKSPAGRNPALTMPAGRTPSIITSPGGVLTAQTLPCRVMETLTPTAINEVRPGVFVIDLGQNITGWAQLTRERPGRHGSHPALRGKAGR